MSVLGRDDVSVNVYSGFGEEVSERGELGVKLGFGADFFDLGRGFHFEGAAAIANGEERLRKASVYTLPEKITLPGRFSL